MKPQFISTKGWSTEKWLEFRTRGLGGSDIGTIFGLNPYKSKLQLHLEKAGQWENEAQSNFYMYRGKTTENMIVQSYWRFFTTSPESVLINAVDTNFIKKDCKNYEGYFVNPLYPQLFASPDRILPIGHINILTGEPLQKRAILEVKNTTTQEANKYESGLSPMFLAQIMLYLLVLDLDYAEIILLKDGTWPELLAFERSDEFCEAIVEQSTLFWANVMKARELLTMPQTPDMQEELVRLEPGVEDSEAYLDFIKDRYRNQEQGRKEAGSDELYQRGRSMKVLDKEIGELEKEQLLHKNTICDYLLKQNVEQLDFSSGEYIRLKKDIKGSWRFTNSIKI